VARGADDRAAVAFNPAGFRHRLGRAAGRDRTGAAMWWFGDFVKDFLAIWVVLDPTTVLPIFIALTAGLDGAKRRRVALTTVLISLAILVFFIVLGQIVITSIGISLHAFQIAGGIILFLFSVELVIGKDAAPVAEGYDRGSLLQMSIYPLAVPTIAGPGSMLTVMLRTDNTRFSVLEQIHTTAAVVLVLVVIYLMLLGAAQISRLIGVGGAAVIKRIMGMILAAYAVTLVLQGTALWLHLPPI
jgi:multiple antibiotic resistance protein